MARSGSKSDATRTAAWPRVFAQRASTRCARSQLSTLPLSQMADQKASILMGASFVVFSHLRRPLARPATLPWSLAMLALSPS